VFAGEEREEAVSMGCRYDIGDGTDHIRKKVGGRKACREKELKLKGVRRMSWEVEK